MEESNRKQSLGSVILFGLIACLLYGLGAGLRSDIGILLNPLAEHTGLQYNDVSMCIAVMQLVFGAAQPVFGIEICMQIIGDNKDLAKQFFETVPHGLAMAVYSRATVQNYHDYALDNHPLGASRINAPFSSFDIFYEVYDIKEGDPMYTASENRLHLW